MYHNYWKKGGRITLPFGNIFTLGGDSTPQKEHIWKFKNKQGINNWKNAVFRRNHGCTETLIYAVKHMKGYNKEYDEKNAAIWQILQKQ